MGWTLAARSRRREDLPSYPSMTTAGLACVQSPRTVNAMADLERGLLALAEATHHGFGFLTAYGLTWLVASLLWRVKGSRVGAYAALFQGMVALPIALGLTAVAATADRPDNPLLNSLSIALSMGQILMIPLVVILIIAARYDIAVGALAATTAVHFVPYSWLYQTPVYVVIGVLIGLGTAVLVQRGLTRERSSGGGVCALTGGVLLVGAVVAYVL